MGGAREREREREREEGALLSWPHVKPSPPPALLPSYECVLFLPVQPKLSFARIYPLPQKQSKEPTALLHV